MISTAESSCSKKANNMNKEQLQLLPESNREEQNFRAHAQEIPSAPPPPYTSARVNRSMNQPVGG